VVNSSQGGGSKDTWVLASRASLANRELGAAQIVRSLPTPVTTSNGDAEAEKSSQQQQQSQPHPTQEQQPGQQQQQQAVIG
jgi:hypothetical protein